MPPLLNSYRAKLDKHDKLLNFVLNLEAACVETVESGKMTKDLALLIHGPKSVFSLHYFLCRFIISLASFFFLNELVVISFGTYHSSFFYFSIDCLKFML